MQLNKDKLLVKSILECFCRQSEESNLINHVDIVHLHSIPKEADKDKPVAIGCDIEIYAQFSPLEGITPVKGMEANQICLDAHVKFKNCCYNESLGVYEWVGNEMGVDKDIYVFYGSGHSPENAIWHDTEFKLDSESSAKEDIYIINTIIDNVFKEVNERKAIDFSHAIFDETLDKITEKHA
ncbi:hypothetical protein ACTXIV_02405 [Psychrobacter celer]|uniref:hypothetical protein n=1 Tax=Psychrobacter celer TaxID=306572 RepID=UPI003FD1ECD4